MNILTEEVRDMPLTVAVANFKSEPVSFMMYNVMVYYGAYIDIPHIYNFTITGERRCPHYYLLEKDDNLGDDAPETIRAYWCPYKEDQTLGVIVGPEANYMFTQTMDGCSLGVGSKTPDGRRLVSHSNAVRIGVAVDAYASGSPEERMKKGRYVQGLVQYGRIKRFHANEGEEHTLACVLHPNKYRHPSHSWGPLMATTFGVRDERSNEWAFYYQMRSGAGHYVDLMELR